MNIIKEIKHRIIEFKFRCKGVELHLAKGCRFKHCKLRNKGKGNKIFIGEGACIDNCQFTLLGSDSTIKIGNSAHICNMEFHMEHKNNEIIIGERVGIARNVQLAACEGTKITIGDETIIAHETSIRTTDSHSILDAEGRRINHAQDIFIGNHVWVGFGVLILKGSRIADNNILAAKSIISQKAPYEENIILAGSPAKKLKENINWDFHLK